MYLRQAKSAMEQPRNRLILSGCGQIPVEELYNSAIFRGSLVLRPAPLQISPLLIVCKAGACVSQKGPLASDRRRHPYDRGEGPDLHLNELVDAVLTLTKMSALRLPRLV